MSFEIGSWRTSVRTRGSLAGWPRESYYPTPWRREREKLTCRIDPLPRIRLNNNPVTEFIIQKTTLLRAPLMQIPADFLRGLVAFLIGLLEASVLHLPRVGPNKLVDYQPFFVNYGL